MHLNIVFLLLVFLLTISFSNCENGNSKSKTKKKNWEKIIDTVDKEWEQGDESVELMHDFEINKKISERKSKKVNFDNPQEVKKMVDDPLAFAGSGAANKMAFIDLKDKKSDGNSWSKKDVDDLSSRWLALMRTGSLTAGLFNIGDEGSSNSYEPRLLVSMDKTWLLQDILKFVLSQPETKKITLDNKDYFPGHFGDNDIDDDL